ncbi:hypothetical protein WOLCODRAFT_167269 [Wolfiporia cocos MD-104 SS10]|uniref:Uncharacterized protein n=1 Tax=Wolfiporia cocos (strain MD-104) TaxID=742152 RepID=A0A2H3JB43_WOLCO|nr:hypothetical protein WOLCODRAFT_167269 [Wolfiporia cocos MD-104 SS10]
MAVQRHPRGTQCVPWRAGRADLSSGAPGPLPAATAACSGGALSDTTRTVVRPWIYGRALMIRCAAQIHAQLIDVDLRRASVTRRAAVVRAQGAPAGRTRLTVAICRWAWDWRDQLALQADSTRIGILVRDPRRLAASARNLAASVSRGAWWLALALVGLCAERHLAAGPSAAMGRIRAGPSMEPWRRLVLRLHGDGMNSLEALRYPLRMRRRESGPRRVPRPVNGGSFMIELRTLGSLTMVHMRVLILHKVPPARGDEVAFHVPGSNYPNPETDMGPIAIDSTDIKARSKKRKRCDRGSEGDATDCARSATNWGCAFDTRLDSPGPSMEVRRCLVLRCLQQQVKLEAVQCPHTMRKRGFHSSQIPRSADADGGSQTFEFRTMRGNIMINRDLRPFI